MNPHFFGLFLLSLGLPPFCFPGCRFLPLLLFHFSASYLSFLHLVSLISPPHISCFLYLFLFLFLICLIPFFSLSFVWKVKLTIRPSQAFLMHPNHYFQFPMVEFPSLSPLFLYNLVCWKEKISFPLNHYQIYKDILMEIEIHVTYFLNYYFFLFSFCTIFSMCQLYNLFLIFSNKNNYVTQLLLLLLFLNSKR